METTLFSAADIRQITHHVGLDYLMDQAINELTRAFADYDPQHYDIPAREGFEYQQPQAGLIEWMPTMAVGHQVALKVVGYHPSNPGINALPSVLSTVLHLDCHSGHLLGLMDATFLTAIRTGAASAIASRILAPANSRTLGLIGCGAQAVSQLHALSRGFSLERVLIYDTDPNISASFSQRVAVLQLSNVEIITTSLEQLLQEAEIICTTTSVDIGSGPVFEDAQLLPGVHVNAVGSDFPGKIELPRSLLHRSLVCPDFYSQAIKEGESQQLTPQQIGPDIVTLVKHQDEYQGFRDRPTVFDSTGWALEDFVMSNLIASYGRELGCGTQVSLACIGADPKNPYEFLQQTPWGTAQSNKHHIQPEPVLTES